VRRTTGLLRNLDPQPSWDRLVQPGQQTTNVVELD
jgi:hypothetical protein